MPTYEYQCDACDHRFDELQSMKDPPLKKCPSCGKLKLRRLFGGGAAIIFKGSGFYETDYRSESYKKAAKAEQEATSKTDSASTTSTTPTAAPAKSDSASKSSAKTSKSPE